MAGRIRKQGPGLWDTRFSHGTTPMRASELCRPGLCPGPTDRNQGAGEASHRVQRLQGDKVLGRGLDDTSRHFRDLEGLLRAFPNLKASR